MAADRRPVRSVGKSCRSCLPLGYRPSNPAHSALIDALYHPLYIWLFSEVLVPSLRGPAGEIATARWLDDGGGTASSDD